MVENKTNSDKSAVKDEIPAGNLKPAGFKATALIAILHDGKHIESGDHFELKDHQNLSSMCSTSNFAKTGDKQHS